MNTTSICQSKPKVCGPVDELVRLITHASSLGWASRVRASSQTNGLEKFEMIHTICVDFNPKNVVKSCARLGKITSAGTERCKRLKWASSGTYSIYSLIQKKIHQNRSRRKEDRRNFPNILS